MALPDDLRSQVASTFSSSWTQRDGTVVPEPTSVKLSNDAVRLNGAVLYADLAESSSLVKTKKATFAAAVYKSYLYCAARLIRNLGGSVTAYDGDRVMGVFIGRHPRADAARCALQINWARRLVNEELRKVYTKSTYEVQHAVGVDYSALFVARTGVRGDNDLVWVGRAANHAAKLSEIRQVPYCSFITAEVYNGMSHAVKYSTDGRSRWEKSTWALTGDTIYRSRWYWSP